MDQKWYAAVQAWQRRTEVQEDWDRRQTVINGITELNLERDPIASLDKPETYGRKEEDCGVKQAGGIAPTPPFESEGEHARNDSVGNTGAGKANSAEDAFNAMWAAANRQVAKLSLDGGGTSLLGNF